MSKFTNFKTFVLYLIQTPDMTTMDPRHDNNGPQTWQQWTPDMTTMDPRHDNNGPQTWQQWTPDMTTMDPRHDNNGPQI